MQNKDTSLLWIVPIEDTTWRLDNLPIPPALELLRFRSAVRVRFKLSHMFKDAAN